MRKHIKKTIALIFTLIMVINLAACETKSAPKSTPENNSVKEEKTTEDSEKPVKLTAWAWGPNVNIPALDLAGKFYNQEHPNITLEVLEIAQNDVVQKMNAALGSGSTKGLPNIVLIEDYKADTFLEAYPDAFVPLQDAVNMGQFVQYKQFLKGPNGEQYGLPFDIGTGVLFYRKDLIEKAGYTEEDINDLTWSEYFKLAADVKKATGVDMQALDPTDMGLIRMILQSESKWYVEEDGKTVNINNDAMKEAITIYTDLLKSGNVKVISEWAQLIGSANSGEVAGVAQGCWFVGNIIKEESQSGLWRVAPIPHLDNTEQNYTNLGGSSWYVLNNVEGQEAAVDLLSATLGSNTELYKEYMEKTGTTTSFIPMQTEEIYQKGLDFFGGQPIHRDFSDWANKIPPVNYGSCTYQVEDIIKVAVQDILGGMSVEDALEEAQQQADAQIQ